MNTSKELVRVGEVAERLGVSPRTIKYYEELGLVQPETRSPGGFRLYGEEDVRRLKRVLQMKGLGYSLAAIRELLAARDAAQEADKATVLRTAVNRLKDREREVTMRIQQMREDLKRAEVLREELQHDITLCKSRLETLEE
jgi:DNA-binding transcriptional MerR regulator